MTGGYTLFTRGIPLDLKATMRKAHPRVDFNELTIRDLEELLEEQGFEKAKWDQAQLDHITHEGVPDGMVVIGWGDDMVGDEKKIPLSEAFAILTDRLRFQQYWAAPSLYPPSDALDNLSLIVDPSTTVQAMQRLLKQHPQKGALKYQMNEKGVQFYMAEWFSIFIPPSANVHKAASSKKTLKTSPAKKKKKTPSKSKSPKSPKRKTPAKKKKTPSKSNSPTKKKKTTTRIGKRKV